MAKRPKRLLSALRAAFRIVLFLSPLLFGFLPPALAIETIAKQAFLIDMTTGEVLFEKNAAEGALLLTYNQQHSVRLQRRLVARSQRGEAAT